MALTPEEEQLLSELQADLATPEDPNLLPVRSGGLIGGDSASISNPAPEPPYKGFWDALFSWTEPEGQISAGGVPMLDYSSYNPKTKQLVNGPIEQAPGLRKSLGSAMEMAGAAIPYAAAGTTPLGAAASYLGMPALSTLGGFLGERGAIGAGLRPPKDFMSSVKELPLEFGANAVLNAPFATAERMAGPGVFGGNARQYSRDMTTAEAANVPGVPTESFIRSNPKTAQGQAVRDAITSGEDVIQQSDLFNGGTRFETDPVSGAGRFKSEPGVEPINSITGANQMLDEQIPKIQVARDTAVKSYNDAYATLKQSNPEAQLGVSMDDVFSAPIQLPDGSAGPILSDFLTTLISNKNRTATSIAESDAANALMNGLTNDFRRARNGTFSPSEAMASIANLDNEISRLGGYEAGTPDHQIAQATLPILRQVRASWKNAFNNSLTRIEQAGVGKNMNLPPANFVQRLDDSMHTLIPVKEEMNTFSGEITRALGSTNIPTKVDDPFADEFRAFLSRRGLIGKGIDYIGDIFGGREAGRTARFRNFILDKDKTAFSQPNEMFDLRSNPPTPPMASPGMMGASRAIAGTAAAVNAAAPMIQSTVAKAEEYAPAQELLPPGASSPAAQVHNYNQGKPNAFLPRNLNALDPQGIALLIDSYAPPEQAQPLLIQWKRLVASGQKKEMAKFLTAMTDVNAFPDMPIHPGAVTGLASEFDLGDGVARLFSDIDKMKWEEEIENSTLTTDEKALRVSRLRQYGEAVPFNIKLNAVVNPNLTVADKVKLNVINSHNFTPRTNTATGSRKVEY